MFEKIAKHASTLIVCLLCFGLGISIPVTIQSIENNDELEKFNSIYKILKEKWYYSDSYENIDETLIEQAISGMVDFDKDAHTNYFSLEQAQKFSSSLEGSNVGIGISLYLDENNNIVCDHIFMDSPAQKAKLKKGDIITKVDDLICSNEDYQDVISYIKDSENKEIKIEYIRNEKTYTTNIIPCSYDSTVVCEVYNDIGYVILNSFSESSAKTFHSALSSLQKKGIKKLVLDLRDDTGGYLTSVLDIASCLLPENTPVFIEKQKNETTTKMTSDAYETIEMDQIVVLQNENTASAAEVLIGALKENLESKVTLIGTTTYGKGSEQVSVPFSDGTSLKYTIAKWETPSGKSIDGTGFEADIEVNKPEVLQVTYKEMKDDEVIERDSVNYNAKALQVYLDFLGYSVDRKDEYFSIQSSDALKQYQSDHGLEVSGNCDFNTFQMISNQVSIQIHKEQLDPQLDCAFQQLT
ncbi:S41 family peptidase [Floccifex sp.]|uniref:S41 family peptidase n=1 Tax=Floccifex sp. TaxID=2815810 RepID=UPI003F06043A